MDKYLYLDVIPKIRVYEKKLIDKSKMDRILELNTSKEVFKFLSESSYGENSNNDINALNYEQVLLNELSKLFSDINQICKDELLLSIFTKKYFYNNLKVLLKSKFLKIQSNDLLFNLPNIDNEKLIDAINNDNYSYFDGSLSTILKKIVATFEENKDYKQLDINLDKIMFIDMKETANKINNDFLNSYINRSIDVFNVKTVFRIKKLGLDKKLLDEVVHVEGNIPLSKLKSIFLDSKENIVIKFSNMEIYKYIKNGLEKFINDNEINTLEVELDNYLVEYLKNGKITTSGLSPIVGYINAKENELKNIRLIVVSKLNNIPPDFIKGRLSLNYV